MPKLPSVPVLVTKRAGGYLRFYLCFLYAASWTLCFLLAASCPAQERPAPEKSDSPAIFDLLETKVRFESNGDSRKEVHAIVKIHSELGVRQFANLTFDFNRSFQSVEIPLVRITHASGGIADILPSAVTDNPNPAVVNFPAYHDVRVKSVRILGLAPGDTLEYHVITTTTHHPLAPDFWLDHTFDRTGVVSHELFELDLPGSLYFEAKLPPGCKLEWMLAWNNSRVRVCGSVPYSSSSESSAQSPTARSVFSWDFDKVSANGRDDDGFPDVIVSTFDNGLSLVERLAAAFNVEPENEREMQLHLRTTAPNPKNPGAPLQGAYNFVSQKLRTVDLPVGATGFRLRAAKEILNSGYATPEEKCMLLAAFVRGLAVSRYGHPNANSTTEAQIVFLTSHRVPEEPLRPSMLEQPLVVITDHKKQFALDPSLEVAPFALIPPRFRGKQALTLTPGDAGDYRVAHWITVPVFLPFAAAQQVHVEAALTADGTLNATVRYSMRGDSELLLRQTFHQSAHEKWTEVAQLLALSDGFRGTVTTASASDPYATRDPFTVEYEITQPKFVDWAKSPVRIPAILPLVGLPDPPTAQPPSGSQNSARAPIELGTPLDVHTTVTLHLPPGTTVEYPAGTNVERDYATFSSSYSTSSGVITASRHIRFIARELPASRAADYNAFVHAVQGDQGQRFTLFAPAARPPASGKSEVKQSKGSATPR